MPKRYRSTELAATGLLNYVSRRNDMVITIGSYSKMTHWPEDYVKGLFDYLVRRGEIESPDGVQFRRTMPGPGATQKTLIRKETAIRRRNEALQYLIGNPVGVTVNEYAALKGISKGAAYDYFRTLEVRGQARSYSGRFFGISESLPNKKLLNRSNRPSQTEMVRRRSEALNYPAQHPEGTTAKGYAEFQGIDKQKDGKEKVIKPTDNTNRLGPCHYAVTFSEKTGQKELETVKIKNVLEYMHNGRLTTMHELRSRFGLTSDEIASMKNTGYIRLTGTGYYRITDAGERKNEEFLKPTRDAVNQ